MSKPFANPVTTPAVQAENVLRAWVARDEIAFRDEICHTLEFCSTGRGGLDEENFELLKAVVEPLRELPLSDESEAMVHLCIDLLAHLAGHSWGDCEAWDGAGNSRL